MLRLKNENEMHKYGLTLDPHDPAKALPIGQPAESQQDAAANDGLQNEPTHAGSEPHTETTESHPAESVPPQSDQSFTRETLNGALGDISDWDDQSLLTGIEKECEAILALESNRPGRYQRLGTFYLEALKRFGEEYAKDFLRRNGIDRTTAWRMEQIAKLYTYDQAMKFASVRAILKTLPSKQPRKPKPKAGLTGGGDHHPISPKDSSEVRPELPTDETLLDSFVRFGVEIRETLGDEVLDAAVNQIKSHIPETFETMFVEV